MYGIVNIDNIVLQSSNLLRGQTLIPSTKKKIYNMLGVQIIAAISIILQHIKFKNHTP